MGPLPEISYSSENIEIVFVEFQHICLLCDKHIFCIFSNYFLILTTEM